MGMSTHIKAFSNKGDSEYEIYKDVYLACLKAKVQLPKEVAWYFNCDRADYADADISEKTEIPLEKDVHYELHDEENKQGFIVDLKDLPKDVTKLIFYNSY